MVDPLASLLSRVGETEAVCHVVEAPFEHLHEPLAGDAFHPGGLPDVRAELTFQDAVGLTGLLLLPQLDPVFRQATPAAGLHVLLTGRALAPFDGTARRMAPVALQEELDAVASAQPTYGSFVSCHGLDPELLVAGESWSCGLVYVYSLPESGAIRSSRAERKSGVSSAVSSSGGSRCAARVLRPGCSRPAGRHPEGPGWPPHARSRGL